MERAELKTVVKRLSDVRSSMLSEYPFFGRLIMRLPLSLSECGTAYTDMTKIVFDPEFAFRLSDGELAFVFMHEIMHCVLKHCTRGRGKFSLLYNIACDIVVNSVIFEAMGVTHFYVDGVPAMHLAPDGKEGRLYSSEEVYEMLLKEEIEKYKKSVFFSDSHDEWESIIAGDFIENDWDGMMSKIAKTGVGGVPESIKRLVASVSNAPKINWRQILHDFIQSHKYDYTFIPPDNRYEGDFIIPAFNEAADDSKVEKLWFLVDTSASVSDRAISCALAEICDAMEQIGSLSGEISFFDSEVSRPEFFDSTKKLLSIAPVGGGGTSFIRIFQRLPDFFKDELPRAVIIITDGEAYFPDEKEALGVPVIWLMVDSEVKAPFGECVYISTDDLDRI